MADLSSQIAIIINQNKGELATISRSPVITSGDHTGGTGNDAGAPFSKPALHGETVVFGPSIAEKTGNTVIIMQCR